MARLSQLNSGGGGGLIHAVEHPYYLKKMPGNPFIGTTHDGSVTTYMKGFVSKPMNWLYRYRYNRLPVGIPTGFYNQNPVGKHVHWLEVSTIEKMRVQLVGEEAFGPAFLCSVVIFFTLYQGYRYIFYHPDLTLYNVTLWTTKPFITMYRNSWKQELSQPCFRYLQRVPEFYMYDPIRDLYDLGLAANDPFVEKVKAAGRENELYMKRSEYTSIKPNLREIFAHDPKPPSQTTYF